MTEADINQENNIDQETKQIVEVFKVHEPAGYAVVTRDKETHELQYNIFEPTFTAEEQAVFSKIRDLLVEQIDVALSDFETKEKAQEYLTGLATMTIKDFHLKVSENSLEKLLYFIVRDYLGYGKIDVVMRDSHIEDISCNGVDVPVYVWHREFESIKTNLSFATEAELSSFIIRLAYRTGRMVSMANPILDATLPDGSRIQITFGQIITKKGSTFTIRKFKADPYTIVDLIKLGTLSTDMAAYFWYLIENRFNIFVCGPTASGKTTTLNCIANLIHPDYKIVTIEDTPEIKVHQLNWFRSVTRQSAGSSSEISLFDLLKAAMRQRPDFLIVGEIRGAEAYTLFQAIATGHGGISTLHAESVPAVIHRLETEPMNIPRSLIVGLNVIVIQNRLQVDGKPARRVVTTTELVGVDPRTNELITNDVFKYSATEDENKYSGRSYLLEKIAKVNGKSVKEINEEVEKRKIVLDWMARRNIRDFKEVSEIIRNFYLNPQDVIRLTRVG